MVKYAEILTDALGNAKEYAYDPLGFLVEERFPDGGVALYARDLAGRLLACKRQMGRRLLQRRQTWYNQKEVGYRGKRKGQHSRGILFSVLRAKLVKRLV